MTVVEGGPPDAAWPEVEWPDVEWPEVEWPEVEWPDVDSPDVDRVEPSTGELLEQLVAAPPGPGSVLMLSELGRERLSRDQALTLVAAWEKQLAWVTAQQQAALVVAGEPDPEWATGWDAALAEEAAYAEVGAAIGLSAAAAYRRVNLARALARAELAGARVALAAGRLPVMHAVTLVEETESLTPAGRQQVADRVLGRADTQTLAQFRRAVRRAVAAVDPARLQAAHTAGLAARTVEVYPEPAGMAALRVTGSAPDIELVYAALSRAASAAGVGPDGIDAARADALLDWARHALTTLPTPPAGAGGHRVAEIQVVTDLPTLLGLAEHPGWLTGYGPIPASAVRAVAADADWRRFLTDPTTGELLDRGRQRYRPNPALAAFVIARDRTCRFPGCARRAHRCDLDHITPYPAGPTTRANLMPLCRRHHRLKTHTRWQVHRNPTDHTITWTSPTGRQYTLPPVRYPPDG